MTMRLICLICSAIFITAVIVPSSIVAQSRDYFTDQEIELVRDANEIDKRIEVLVKAVDRRVMVINNDNSQSKQIEKDREKWGELPGGTKLELYSDISKILQKAIDDIDELAERKEMNEKILKANVENESDEYAKQIIKSNGKKFPVAVYYLADASRRLLPVFESLNVAAVDQREKGALLRAIESCNMIIEASGQIARPVDKKRKN